MAYTEADWRAINAIRLLAADATFKANSGHPGAPMGMAPVAHVLFSRFLRFNPKNPKWANRDRFVMSNGHGSMLQYALLHLFGYDLSLDELKNFRQLGSRTPGHPECFVTPGVEVTTGPLGQGFSNAVGIAMAEEHTAAVFNRPDYNVIDSNTYIFFGDGCSMEGVTSEAASLAGHQKLGKIIAIYDDNHISIDGDTKFAFTEDVTKRFEAYGWHTLHVADGDNDLDGIEAAIRQAKAVTDRPTMIRLTTTIGYGSLVQGTGKVHGAPLKVDDLKQVKAKFGYDPEQSFVVPQEVYNLYGKRAAEGEALESEWNAMFERYASAHPELATDLRRRLSGDLIKGFESKLPKYTATDGAKASRKLSEAVLESIHEIVPELVCGSADLTESNNTRWKDAVDFQHPSIGLGDRSGRYVRYGVREHAMAAIMNGMAAYGTVIPAGGTFLNFVSYAAGAVRLASISGHRVIHVATHDSIGLGEDGPTHQPIETLAHFRAMPNMMVWRPADGNETSAAYLKALTAKETPSIIALTRQNLPQLEGSSIEKAAHGGYVLREAQGGAAAVILVSTGSEVSICVDAAKQLEQAGYPTRIVSMPCTSVFNDQSMEYRLSVLPDGVPIMSFEALSTLGWQRYSHEQFGLDRFGLSAPYKKVYEEFKFTPQGVAEQAEATINHWKDVKPLRSPVNRKVKGPAVAFGPIRH